MIFVYNENHVKKLKLEDHKLSQKDIFLIACMSWVA